MSAQTTAFPQTSPSKHKTLNADHALEGCLHQTPPADYLFAFNDSQLRNHYIHNRQYQRKPSYIIHSLPCLEPPSPQPRPNLTSNPTRLTDRSRRSSVPVKATLGQAKSLSSFFSTSKSMDRRAPRLLVPQSPGGRGTNVIRPGRESSGAMPDWLTPSSAKWFHRI